MKNFTKKLNKVKLIKVFFSFLKTKKDFGCRKFLKQKCNF